MPAQNLMILCTGEFSLGHILSGYINFYSGKRINSTTVNTQKNTIHPLAIQVMKEDGIDISTYKSVDRDSVNSKSYDLIINLLEDKTEHNDLTDPQNILFPVFKRPAIQAGYEQVLQEYRELREQIKQYSIELVGKHCKTPL